MQNLSSSLGMNNAAINIHARAAVWTRAFISLGWIPGVGLFSHRVTPGVTSEDLRDCPPSVAAWSPCPPPSRCFLIVQSTGDFVVLLLVLLSWEFSLRISIILLWLTAVLEVMISPLTVLTLSPRCRAALLLEKPCGCNLYFAFHLRVVERYFTFPGRKKKKKYKIPGRNLAFLNLF